MAKATKNQYNENFYKNEYEEYINSYLGEYPSSCDVDKILKKWKVSSTDSSTLFDEMNLGNYDMSECFPSVKFLYLTGVMRWFNKD